MSDTNPLQKELRRTVRLLREIAELANNASLSGSMQAGTPRAIQQVNAVLTHLEQTGEVPTGFFPPLANNASFDEAGVAAAQLAAYIDEPELKPERPWGGNGPLIAVNGNIENFDTEKLSEIGKIIRENMTDWFKSQEAPAAEDTGGSQDSKPKEAEASEGRYPPPTPPTPPVAALSSPPAHPAQFIPDPQNAGSTRG